MEKKYTKNIVESQNIVEQVNFNKNNTSLTISRRHFICKSSIIVAEMNQKFQC